MSQHYELPEPLAWALMSKAIFCSFDGRLEEARLNYEGALLSPSDTESPGSSREQREVWRTFA